MADWTPYELEIIQDKRFLRTKWEVIGKANEVWNALQQALPPSEIKELEYRLDIQFQPSKISRGENYKGLPYIVLDAPRYFSEVSVCTFRSLFWWGNYYQFSWVIAGPLWEELRKEFVLPNTFIEEGIYLDKSRDPWQHDREEGNYVTFNPDENLAALPFLKLSRFLPLGAEKKEIIRTGVDFFGRMIFETA